MYTQDVIQKVNDVLSRAASSGERVSGWEELKVVLKGAKLAWISQVAPDMVGVHPGNRSSLGVGASEAHHHGARIVQSGWSWSKASDVSALECPPPPYDRDAQQMNKLYVDMSEGGIPPLRLLKLLSIGGAHTNTFLRSVQAESKCACSKLADSRGRFNRSEITCNRDGLREAVETGMKWTVFHWQVADVFPGFVDFAVKAMNTDSRNEVSEVEVMLEMSMQVAAAIKQKMDPDWLAIQKQSCLSQPPCASYIGALAKFVQLNGGGPDGELARELADFQKVFGCSDHGPSRRLGSEFFNKLNSMSFGKIKLPYVINACIEANLAAPSHMVVDGICKAILPSQLQALTQKGNHEVLLQAEKLMDNVRKLCSGLGIEKSKAVRIIGRCDVRCIHHILKKGKEIEGVVFKNIGQIAEACYKLTEHEWHTRAEVFVCTISCLISLEQFRHVWPTFLRHRVSTCPLTPCTIATRVLRSHLQRGKRFHRHQPVLFRRLSRR